MNESIVLNNLLVQHPLYHAVEKCIDREITDTYDYHDFFPLWNFQLNYRTVIQEVFKVDERQVEVFIKNGGPFRKLNNYVYLLECVNSQDLSKRLLRFLLALPVCEYEIFANSMTPSSSTGSDNIFSKSLSLFKYDNACLSEIGNGEIASTLNAIFISLSNKPIKGIGEFAFHDYKLLQREYSKEDPYLLAFRYYLIEPICSLLSIIFGMEILVDKSIHAENNVALRVETDITIHREHQVFSVIEVKKFPILLSYREQNTVGIGPGFLRENKTNDFMRQLIVQMIYFKTNMGVLTDAYVAIFVEIDLDYFENNVDLLAGSCLSKTVPIRYKVLNCHSAAPTLREALLHFCYRSVVDDEKLRSKQESMLRFRKYLRKTQNEYEEQLLEIDTSFTTGSGMQSVPSSRSSNTSEHMEPIGEEEEVTDEERIEFSENDGVYMQNGDMYNTQLVKIDARYVKKYLLQHRVDDNEKLVAKIYDPVMASRIHDKYKCTRLEILELCVKGYNFERKFCQLLSEDPEFNSCYVPTKRGTLKVVVDKYYITRGSFNLFRHLDTIPLPQDDETYRKTKKQLEIIHLHGIVHGDIRELNILYTTERKVYIIDFAYSIFENKNDLFKTKSADMAGLRDIFSEVDSARND